MGGEQNGERRSEAQTPRFKPHDMQGVMVAHATLFIVHQKVAKGGDINSPHDRPLGLYGTKQTINSFLLLQT